MTCLSELRQHVAVLTSSDPAPLPPAWRIDEGLRSLPRQIATFAGFRRTMLGSLRSKENFQPWRARGLPDAGLMLVEMWAYVCDVLSFYDEVIADESYVRTAKVDGSLRKLTALVGYVPRPAIAPLARLVALAEGSTPITIPAGTAFQSGAFDNEPPHTYETETALVVHPFHNQWELVPPVTAGTLDGPWNYLILDARTATVARGDTILVQWTQKPVSSFAWKKELALLGRAAYPYGKSPRVPWEVLDPYQPLAPTPETHTEKLTVADVLSFSDDYGRTFREIVFAPGQKIRFGQGPVEVSDIQVYRLRRSTVATAGSGGIDWIIGLPGLGLVPDDQVLLETPSERLLVKITAAQLTTVPIDDTESSQTDNPLISDFVKKHVRRPVLKIRTGQKVTSAASVTIYYALEPGGTVCAAPSERRRAVSTWAIANQSTTAPPTAAPDTLILQDRCSQAVEAAARFRQEQETLDITSAADNPELTTPVYAYGNIVPISRGQTVPREVVGSGDASQASQSFTLKKGPLTYLPISDPANAQGLKSTLTVWVNGIAWKEVPYFFGVPADAQVYIVRQNEQGQSVLTFGDGIHGARLPTGKDNIIASYRFGAGSAVPPARSITQMAKPVKGITGVFNPCAAFGGQDAESGQNLRGNGPRVALLLDRVVSITDMEALAARFLDVRSVTAMWTWDDKLQRAAAKIWYIGSQGTKDLLLTKLRQYADPTTPIAVECAQSQPVWITITLEIDSRYLAEDVTAAVRHALIRPQGGPLALENIGIGQYLYRTSVLETCMSVDGVRNVPSILWGLREESMEPWADFVKKSSSGTYFDWENGGLKVQ